MVEKDSIMIVVVMLERLMANTPVTSAEFAAGWSCLLVVAYETLVQNNKQLCEAEAMGWIASIPPLSVANPTLLVQPFSRTARTWKIGHQRSKFVSLTNK